MTISQIRNQIHRLQRKFARELAIYRLRQVAEDVADAWKLAIADREELPQPLQIVRRIADTGQISHNYMDLHRYVQRCRDSMECLTPQKIVLALLPWAHNHRYDDLLYQDLLPAS